MNEDTVSIPATMFDSTVNAMIGARGGAIDYFEGMVDSTFVRKVVFCETMASLIFDLLFSTNAKDLIRVERFLCG